MAVTTHTVRSAIPKKQACTRKPHGSVFYRTGVLTDRSFIARIGIFYLFCSCDLDLDPMTFMYEVDLYFLEMYSAYELPASRLSKVIV